MTAPPGNSPTDGGTQADATEILARFARSAAADAPTGTIQLRGHPPVAFTGWLDLMAQVEEMLASDRERRVP